MTRHPITIWERRFGVTESPIESIFLTTFCQAAERHGYRLRKVPDASDVIAVRPQQRVGIYRADFVIAFRFFGSEIDLIVEADGHDFHEKTAIQAARDKKRDRYFSKLGYRVLRFTGSEINSNATGCAGEVLAFIMDFQTSQIDQSAMAHR
jgi:very-short-patch-repair endonuclease